MHVSPFNLATSSGEMRSRPRDLFCFVHDPLRPRDSDMSVEAMVCLPTSLETYSVVDFSLPPKNSSESQLPTMVSQSSLYSALPWLKFCTMTEVEIPRERMTAILRSKDGILPMLANSSIKH